MLLFFLTLLWLFSPLDGTADDTVWSPWMLKASTESHVKLKKPSSTVDSFDGNDKLPSIHTVNVKKVDFHPIHRSSGWCEIA